jgi:hypothetical protein
MNIVIKKDYMEELHSNLERNLEFISAAIRYNLSDKDLVAAIEIRLRESRYYLKRAYNPELLKLKHHARACYQKWVKLKASEPITANIVYLEYLKLKEEIFHIENPF